MKTLLNKPRYKAYLPIIFLVVVFAVFTAACSASISRRMRQPKVTDFYLKAIASVPKYGTEPISGELRPVPSSFSIAGGVVWITVPIFEGEDPLLPAEVYDNYKFSEYSWYTNNPEDVRYVVLIDHYYNPSDENGLGDSLIFTIVDLSYNEMVYKSFIKGDGGFPYRELADFLEDLVL